MTSQKVQATDITPLIDKHGRRIDYVRLSVTDRCDFRCVYCMAEKMTFLPRNQVLSLEEIYQLAKAFTELGAGRIRITGGEPLVRRNILSLFERIGKLPGLTELLLTTNGSKLAEMAQPLLEAGVNRINISMDSLDTATFKALTRTGDLAQVKKGIETAAATGFDDIRINTVIMKGRNDHEIIPLVEYAASLGVNIAFIEEMPLGSISEHVREETYCSNDEVRHAIERQFSLSPIKSGTAGPSRYFALAGSDIKVGFISPVSHNFCADCNRVRVTVEGRLLLCLGNEYSTDLREILRSDIFSEAELKAQIVKALDIKPLKHHFYEEDEVQVVRFMNMTGG